MPTVTETTQRLELNQSSRVGVKDQLSGEKLLLWQGLSARIECALFSDTPEAATLVSISNLASVNIVVRKTNANGNILFTQEVTSFDLITYAQWLAETNAQFVFELTELDTTQIVPTSGRLPIYFVVTVVTTDDIPYIAGFGYGEIVDVGFIENPVSSDYQDGRTPIIGGRLLTNLELNGHHLTDETLNAVQESGSVAIGVGQTTGSVVFEFEKSAPADLRFLYCYFQSPGTTVEDIRSIPGIPTAFGFDFGLTAAPDVAGIVYWKVVPKDSAEVSVTPNPRYSNFNGTVPTITRSLTDKLRDHISIKDFGALGDGVADDTDAFNLAMASNYSDVYLPLGNYVVNLTAAQLADKVFYGPGHIYPLGSIEPANYTYLATRPTPDLIVGLPFSGDLSKVNATKFVLGPLARRGATEPYNQYSTTPVVMEYENNSGGSGMLGRITSTASIGHTNITLDTVEGLVDTDQIAFGYGNSATDIHDIDHIDVPNKTVYLTSALTAGHLVDATVINAARTMNTPYFITVTHRGSGDCGAILVRAIAGHEIPVGRNFNENATVFIIAGDVKAEANGVYLQGFEFQCSDIGAGNISYDVACINPFSFTRTKGRLNGGALYDNVWIPYVIASQGSQPLDAGISMSGPLDVGLDLVLGNFTTNGGCAIGMTNDQFIYFNNDYVHDKTQLVGNILGTIKFGYVLAEDAVKLTGNFKVTGDISPRGGAALPKLFKATAILDFPSVAAFSGSGQNVSVPGARDGDIVKIGFPVGADPGGVWKGVVASDDIVTVVFQNFTSGALNPASGTFTIVVEHHGA